jgi:hypothetical protein
MTVAVRSFAKINLGLYIGAARAGGRPSSREEHLKSLDTVLSMAAAQEAQKSLFPKDLATIFLPPLANSLIFKYLTGKSLFLKDLES